jgi:tetratricopeptide (TPR) repeat protein
MLSEEALLVIAALAVAAFLAIALLEALWPTRRRYPRHAGPRRRARVRRRPAAARPRVEPALPRRAHEPLRPATLPTSMTIGPSAPLAPTAPPPEPAPVVGGPVGRAAAPPATTEAGPVAFEECFQLYQAERYAEVLARAATILEERPTPPTPGAKTPHELAALWSLVGLSRQGLADNDGARAAFEEAIRSAPPSERAAYERHLAALALTAGRKLVARAEFLPESAGDERVSALRSAVTWLEQGVACAPEDAGVRAALERARAGLWSAYGQVATGLVHRQEFQGARRLIREALADPAFPDDRREAFHELLATTFSGEVGQLTAHAIRVMQEEHQRETLASLERAEALLASIPDETLTPKRREEVNRRLWWGYTKLGVRRVESGEYEDALEPLFHALHFGGVEPEHQQETRTALARALEGVADVRAASIDELIKQGRRDAAAQEGNRLRALLREGLKVGLSRNDLAQALTKTRQVLEQVEPVP